jgi:hypothetical protein
VFSARYIRLLAVAGGLAFALTGSALSGVAVAAPRTFEQPGASGVTDDAARESRLAAARAQERYYSSYGWPGRPAVSQSTVAAESHDTTWLPIALSILAVFGVLAVGATRRVRMRRRRPDDVRRVPAPAPRPAR